MIEQELDRLIRDAVERSKAELGIEQMPDVIEVLRPRQREHGDYATNVALGLAKAAGRNPREVADVLIRNLPDSEHVSKVEIAGPGFINFFMTHGWLYAVLGDIRRQGRQSSCQVQSSSG